MAAPDLLSLFAFEAQVEPAAVAILGGWGVPAYTQRGIAASLGTPRVEVRLVMGMATGHKRALVGALGSPGQTLPDAWHAQLVLTTVTNRNGGPSNAGRHDELLAKCRVAMLQATGALNARLAWLSVPLVTDAGVIPSVHVDADLDLSPAVFNLQIAIRGDAWPLPPSA